jgi:hypothetical protein
MFYTRTDFESEDNWCIPVDGIHLQFGVKGFGWGELYFYEKDEQLYCDNELMSKETIKRILSIMVDGCELTCT